MSPFARFLAWARLVRQTEWTVNEYGRIRTPVLKKYNSETFRWDCPVSYGTRFPLTNVKVAMVMQFPEAVNNERIQEIPYIADSANHPRRKKLERLLRIKPEATV